MTAALVAAAACDRPAVSGHAGRTGDVLLRGGWIVDGAGNPRYRGDLLIQGDRIEAVGRLQGATAHETLDVAGKIVAPGFIDMLGQSEQNVLIDSRVLSKITQGVTTEVTGEGGSIFPLTDSLVAQDSDLMKKYHFSEDWRDLEGYFRHLEKSGSTINIATFVGATQLRTVVVGTGDRQVTPAELARMTALVDTAMQQGALGVSTALEYAPAFYASTEELITLAREAHRYGGIYATHMRNEGGQEDQALDETFRIGKETGIPLEIWHLKVSGRLSWGRMPKVLAKIDSARTSGLDVTANLYPYIAAATSLDASIPAWAHSGGTDSMLLRLKDPATRARIRAELLAPPQIADRFMRAAGGPAGVIVLPFADSLSRYTGKRLSEIAALQHQDPIETLFDLVTEERARTGAIYFVMSEPDVDSALATWWTSFDTDYGGVAPDGPLGHDGVHPRTYGTFAKILGHYVREQHVLTLESAVRKMTSLPAQRVGLVDRGLLRPGMFADVTVFDPDSIADRATFDAPHQPSVGITYVFVNGKLVLDRGQVTAARPGRGLHGPGYRPRSGR
ncbi:MAG TPA: D-aminoacylase [Gemmatimonadales bacterium]|nr:D-aminoacylase [Gemmatimonadales bacterium]